MNELIFASTLIPGESESRALILARSIRAFAGRLALSPIWFFLPAPAGPLNDDARDELLKLEVRLITFPIAEALLDYPFGGKVIASAEAETMAEAEAANLAWMDVDSIVINEPAPYLLENGIALGYRPVDHTLIGSPFDEPADAFWRFLYGRFQVDAESLFPMTTTVDRRTIRPYFNAGLLLVRPGRALLRKWRQRFLELYVDPALERFYDESILYKLFLHQAILAGVIISTLNHEELVELPPTINYPLHMHDQVPPDAKPRFIDDLVSCRYDTLFDAPGGLSSIAAREPFMSWLAGQAALLGG